jgi:hypothetical protein
MATVLDSTSQPAATVTKTAVRTEIAPPIALETEGQQQLALTGPTDLSLESEDDTSQF